MWAMRRVNVYVAILAMLSAFVSAPLFHVHNGDDHGNPGSFVHAHFLEAEEESHDSGIGIEAPHSHEQGHWADVFTLNTPFTVNFYGVAELAEPLALPSPAVNRVGAAIQTLRAHSPPDGFDSAPRSPPAL